MKYWYHLLLLAALAFAYYGTHWSNRVLSVEYDINRLMSEAARWHMRGDVQAAMTMMESVDEHNRVLMVFKNKMRFGFVASLLCFAFYGAMFQL